MKIKDLAIALKVNKKNRHWNQLTTSWGEKILHGEQQVTDILTEYPKLLSTEGKQSDRTNLKRLIRIYDWIKYYK